MPLEFRLQRADDTLVLAVSVEGLEPRPSVQGWVLQPVGGPAWITVEHQAQHVVEYADPAPDEQEAPILGPRSKTVFSVPSGTPPIPLTVAGVLEAVGRLPMHGDGLAADLAPVAVPPSREGGGAAARRLAVAARRQALQEPAVSSGRGRPGTSARPIAQAAGAAGVTGVFVPSRLELATPVGAARFSHAAAPVERDGLVEAWHSRLAVLTTEAGARPAEVPTSVAVRRAVAYLKPPATAPGADSYLRIVDEEKIASALDGAVNGLLAVTSTTPLTMRRLALSPLGGTVDLDGTWSRADGTWPSGPGAPPEPALGSYRQRVVQGRDVEIRTVERGRLYPLGHPAILVRTTQRVATGLAQGSLASLQTRTVITVRRTTQTYDAGDARGRAWPFTRVTILNPASPPGLDEVHTVFGTPGEAFHVLMVDGRPLVHRCRATDLGGNEVTFSLAQIFVPDGQNVGLAAILWKAFADPASTFADRFGGFDLGGLPVLTAPPADGQRAADGTGGADATTLNVRRVVLNRLVPGEFRPAVEEFHGTSRAVDALNGRTEAVFRYADTYLTNAFGSANKAELLLEVRAAAASFGAQAAGLVQAKTAEIRALSRSIGAVAAQAVPGKDVEKVLSDLAGGHFDPLAWFDLPNARLFGVFPLTELFAKAGATVNDLRNAPTQLVEVVEGRKRVSVQWSTDLLAPGEEFPAVNLPITLGAGGAGPLTMKLDSVTDLDPATGTVRTSTTCIVRNADLLIGPTPQAGDKHLVTLPIRSIRFETTDSGAPDVGVAVGGVQFGGALAFVATLARLLADSGLGRAERAARVADRSLVRRPEVPAVREAPPSGPSIEVVGDVVRAKLVVNLPDVAIGVFSLQDLSFASAFELSLTGAAPPALTMDFATVDNPFRLTVAFIGGGGHLRVKVSTERVVLVAGALEFGAAVAVDLAGVAKGSASVMGGVYFELVGGDVTLTGYLSIKGKLSILGIVSVAVETTLALSYVTATGKLEGSAELAIKIKVFVFKKTVRFEVRKTFAGANSDPTFRELMAPADWPTPDELPWDTYCTAFAAA